MPKVKIDPKKIFAAQLKMSGIENPFREYVFHPTRKWRFDYCWPQHKIALEVEGGVWTGGRHTSGAGFMGDMEKYNEATALGWRILRITPSQLSKTATVELIKRTINTK